MKTKRQHSAFVTVVAWICIALSGAGALILLLQNLAWFFLFRHTPLFQQPMQGLDLASMPEGVAFVLRHYQVFLPAMLLFGVLVLVSSIGLLKRLNWARWAIIGFMTICIIWQFAGLALQWKVMHDIEKINHLVIMGEQGMQPLLVVSLVFWIVFALGMCALCGWIIKRLLSTEVAREFVWD